MLFAAAVAVLLLALTPSAQAADAPSHWCGSGESAVDLPDTSDSAFQVHVVYAYPSDGIDRFSSLAGAISRDVATIDTWWRAQDPLRAPRWDLAAFPGCDTPFGSLDITAVRLQRLDSWYAAPDTVLTRLSSELAAQPTTLRDREKKYLVLYDGRPGKSPLGAIICGLSPSSYIFGGTNAYSGIFLAPPCGDGLGTATNAAATIAHELVHNLGALARSGPPHPCPGDPQHPCDSADDVLWPRSEYGRPLAEIQLDVGHDDYYGHSGAWWDIQDSPFLEHVGETHALPTGPTGLTVSSDGTDVEVSWQPATSPNGPVTYRFARDGVLINTPSVPFAADRVDSRSTHTWTVRAEDSLGLLGPMQEIQYTFTAAPTSGDARSTIDVTRHGIAPHPVTGLHARATRSGIELGWSPAHGLPAAVTYRVTRDGKLFAVVKHGTSLAVAKTKKHGSWVVYAVGGYGAVSPASAPLQVA